MSTMNDVRVAQIEAYLNLAIFAISMAGNTVVEENTAIANLPDNIENSEKNQKRKAFADMTHGDLVRLAAELQARRDSVIFE